MLANEVPGEIIHAGEILDPAKAQVLGDTVLAVFKDYISQPTTPYAEIGSLNIIPSATKESSYDTSQRCNSISLGIDDQTVVNEGIEKFASLLRNGGVTSDLDTDADFFVGTAGGGDWHFDGRREYRLLVNLASTPLGLLIAKVWDERDYEDFFGEDRFRKNGPSDPTRIEQIDYDSGEGVLLDNMREARLQVPHAGVRADGKVFMRLYASHPND